MGKTLPGKKLEAERKKPPGSLNPLVYKVDALDTFFINQLTNKNVWL